MKRWLYTFPGWLAPFFRPALTRVPASRTVYFTFDDGPSPGITPWVLEQLRRYGAQATFFWIGDKVRRYPELARHVVAEGHRVGNHTMHHVSYFRTSKQAYYADILSAQTYIDPLTSAEVRLFRPPYGKISPFMIKHLYKSGFQTVLWTHLTMDFDPSVDPAMSVEILKKRLRPGNIVVFHDSTKAFPSLRIILPALLEWVDRKGWQLEGL